MYIGVFHCLLAHVRHALCTVGGSVQTVASSPGSGNEAIQTGAYIHKLLVQSCSGRPGCGYASASKQIRYL